MRELTEPRPLTESPVELPSAELPRALPGSLLWGRVAVLLWVVFGLYLLDRLASLLMDYWFLQSLGFTTVFWVNFRMGVKLFLGGFLLAGASILVPALVHRMERHQRRVAIHIALAVAFATGYIFIGQTQQFLTFAGVPFHQRDPVFHKDAGYYMFNLPNFMSTWRLFLVCGILALIASVVTAHLVRRNRPRPRGDLSRVGRAIGQTITPCTQIVIVLLGLIESVGLWLSRYSLLFRDNSASSIPAGAEFLDVRGIFSSLNDIYFTIFATVGFTVTVLVLLRRLHNSAEHTGSTNWKGRRALALLIAIELIDVVAFKGTVAVRDNVRVTPNEPVIQLPYIKRHIEATNRAWGLDKVQTVPFTPKGPGDPVPSAESLLASPSLRNASLWPGYMSWLERQIDPEYVPRLALTNGDTTIYGPTIDTFRQAQKLRPYYDFMDIDTVRYKIGGQDTLFASAVRELPLVEPQPWLAWWGQEFVLFTHGYGMVMAPVAGVDPQGLPTYASSGVPSKVTSPELRAANESVYYGEGSGSMAYSDLRGIKEFDHPTEQGRAQVRYPENIKAGVRLDSLTKRLVFGWKSRQFLDIVFSKLINGRSRVHYYRTPLERLERIAPFLYFDTDPYAVVADGGIHWMINGLTVSDRYPYSRRMDLGDKMDRRTPTPRPVRWVNYAQDAVKATVDAYTGKVRLYQFSDEPVVATWAKIYPGLFTPKSRMPAALRSQVQYPVQLMHAQFDDLFIYYHMKDALTFFNMEDMWDDADEVVGPILSQGRAITFSIEPYYWIAQTDGHNGLPASTEATQFAMSMVFTPENALNLRSISTAYMNGDDYGRLVSLDIPKGAFFPAPEQADAAIDQDAFIAQEIGFWNRQGTEVIRGHTTALVVQGEVLYVEPMFIKSVQNPVPQLKRVIVVFRGKPSMGRTLDEAVHIAIDRASGKPIASVPEELQSLAQRRGKIAAPSDAVLPIAPSQPGQGSGIDTTAGSGTGAKDSGGRGRGR